MSKSTKKKVPVRKKVPSKNKEKLNSYSELLEITEGIRGSAYEMVATNANVIRELPTIINTMKDKDADEKDIKQTLSIARTIAKDTDSFIDELKEADEKLHSIKEKGKRSIRVASKNYTSVLVLSTRYQDIATRMIETTDVLNNDLTDIYLKVTGDEPTVEKEADGK